MTWIAKKTVIYTVLLLCFAKTAWAQPAALVLGFDNDILNFPNQTDRYYTNGINVGFYRAALNESFLKYVLVSGNKTNTRLTGVVFEQKMFTPQNLHTAELQVLDRPYAATALVSASQVSVSSQFNYRINSSVGIGVIGSYAGGEFLQNFVHSLTVNSENVNGWNNQIQNDILINYQMQLEKGLINSSFLRLNAIGTAQVGTLQNSASADLFLAVGNLDAYYKNAFGFDSSRQFSAYVFTRIGAGYVFYDATLEGGMIISPTAYTISMINMNHSRIHQSIGLRLNYRKLGIEVGRMWQSAEFKQAQNHAWGYFKTTWCF